MHNLNNDKAIDNLKADLLGRSSFAKHVADIIKHTCLSQTHSFVFGLYGSWGDGKTSFVNLVKECFSKAQSNQQVKNNKRHCIFDILVNGLIKIPLFLFILFFSFENYLLKYDFFINLLESTYNINYNIYFLFFYSFLLKIILLILIIKAPRFSFPNCCSNKNVNQAEIKNNIQIIDFAPWNMIDEKTLLENFFTTIKKSLLKNTCDGEVNKQITKYINAIIKKCSNGIVDFDVFKEKDIAAIKEDLEKVLESSNSKIIVFIDDIDRLEDKEVCLIFKLVKSIANLPNISYFLSFDKDIVATALNKHHEGNGEKYLEKIIQVPFSLPNIREYKLEKILKSEIKEFIDKNTEINEQWKEKYKNSWEYAVYYKFFNFLKNPRSIKRYINLVKINYNNSLKNEINIVDFFLLLIFQLEHTQVYSFIKDNKLFFTYLCDNSRTPTTESREQEIKKYKQELDSILEQYSVNKQDMLKGIICFLFPTIKNIYKDITIIRPESVSGYNINGRICSSENFDKFFWFDCDENDITLSEMREYIALSIDVKLFSDKLLELNAKNKLKIFLGKLEEYIANDIPLENIHNIIKAFFDKGDYFDNTYDDFLSLNIHAYIYRIIIDLLNLKIDNQIEVLKDCISNNESIFPMVQFIGFLADSVKEGSQYKQKYANKTNIKPLINSVLSEIYNLANNDIENIDDKKKSFNGHIISHPMIRNILWFWYHNGDIEKLKSYVDKITDSEKKLLLFLDNTSGVSHCSSGYKSWIEKRLKKDELEMYFNLEKLKERLMQIKDDELSEKDKEIKYRALDGINNTNQF